MDDIYNLLNNYLKSSKSCINETIARFVLFSLNEIPRMRAADVAAACHTSASSVVRFCYELGYNGYIEFKDVVSRYYQNVQDKVLVPSLPLRVLGTDAEYSSSLEKWTGIMRENALAAMLALDREKLMALAEDILRHRYVYVLGAGLSGALAEQLRICLARSGKVILTVLPSDMEMPLSPDRGQTLAIIISQQGRYLESGRKGLPEYLRKNCAKTWLITQLPAQKNYPMSEVIHIISKEDIGMDIHTLLYFEELLGEYCRALMEKNK